MRRKSVAFCLLASLIISLAGTLPAEAQSTTKAKTQTLPYNVQLSYGLCDASIPGHLFAGVCTEVYSPQKLLGGAVKPVWHISVTNGFLTLGHNHLSYQGEAKWGKFIAGIAEYVAPNEKPQLRAWSGSSLALNQTLEINGATVRATLHAAVILLYNPKYPRPPALSAP